MNGRERALFIALVWAVVYPGVLIFSYGFRWLNVDVPLWLEIAISTACTVPAISLLAIPYIERILARAKGESPAELKLDEAREAPGPDPEQVLSPGKRS